RGVECLQELLADIRTWNGGILGFLRAEKCEPDVIERIMADEKAGKSRRPSASAYGWHPIVIVDINMLDIQPFRQGRAQCRHARARCTEKIQFWLHDYPACCQGILLLRVQAAANFPPQTLPGPACPGAYERRSAEATLRRRCALDRAFRTERAKLSRRPGRQGVRCLRIASLSTRVAEAAFANCRGCSAATSQAALA
uniref:hypothetical protein n=1 Tax=Cereibacter azotoformans TaxID=43057 RepID=UPI00195B9A15